MDFYASEAELYCCYCTDANTEIPLVPRTDILNWKDKEAFRVAIPTGGVPTEKGTARYIESFTLPKLSGNHEYTLDFWYAFNTATFGKLFVELEILDGNNNLISAQILYYSPDNITSDTWTNCNISFKPDLSNVQSGYTCRLLFRFVQTQNLSPWTVHISNYIYFNDNDDDSGLLNGVLDWLSRIYHSVAGGVDREGVNHIGIVQGIKNGLTNLGDRISNFFSDLKQGLIDKLEGVKASIEKTINGIQQWFIDLKNNLIDGLKSLFIPSDGYFEAYMQKTKDWAAERFGFLYTAADLMVSMVTDLKELLRDDYNFVLPAARFSLNGQTYTLWNEYTVPMSEYLQNNYMKFAYGTYKTLLGSLFAFALFKYAQKVFDKVMAN